MRVHMTTTILSNNTHFHFIPPSRLFLPSTDNITVAQISQWLVGGTVKSESRSCIPTCLPLNTMIEGTGGRTSCCNTDLCNINYSASVQLYPRDSILLLLFAMVFLKIHLERWLRSPWSLCQRFTSCTYLCLFITHAADTWITARHFTAYMTPNGGTHNF